MVFHISFYCQNQFIQYETINDNKDGTFIPKCWKVKVAKSKKVYIPFCPIFNFFKNKCKKLVSYQLFNQIGKID